MYDFITNNFEISHEEVAYLYKLRWNIELLFKKLKQNFQLHYFYSGNRERHQNSNLVYPDCTTFTASASGKIREQKSLFNHCSTH
ncbi:MAG: transposase [Sphingobacteriales bacterium]|nr:MAG: transposase [Sphingobacteriales bacterium]